jgi:hypothetical protein
MTNNLTSVHITKTQRAKVEKYVEGLRLKNPDKLEYKSVPNFISYVLDKEMKA